MKFQFIAQHLQQYVFQYCCLRDLVNLSLVCKGFQAEVDQTINFIYLLLAQRNFPDCQVGCINQSCKNLSNLTKDIIIVACGTSVYALQLSTLTWQKYPNCLLTHIGMSMEVYHGEIYMISTKSELNMGSVESYCPLTRQWTRRASLPNTISQVGTAVLNGVLYSIGGIDKESKNNNQIYTLDNNTNSSISWNSISNENSRELTSCKACSYKDQIWIAPDNTPNQIQIYNPIRNAFSLGPNFKSFWSAPKLIVVLNRLYIIAWWWPSACNILRHNETENSWQYIESFTGEADCPIAVYHSKIYIFGLRNELNHKWDAYDVRSRKWLSSEVTSLSNTIDWNMPEDLQRFGAACTYEGSKLLWI